MIWLRTWRNRVAGQGIDGIEVMLGFLALLCLLPNVWPTTFVTDWGGKGLIYLGCAFDRGWKLFYFAGGLLMACLLFRYIRERRATQTGALPLTHFTDAVCLFSGLFLLDFFFSTADPYHFDFSSLPFLWLSPFFLLLMFLNRRQTFRVVRLLALLTGAQALLAVVYYAFGWHQFQTPHFGNRTGGTFYDPNVLYSLCLLGAPLCLALAGAQARSWQRHLFLAAGIANLLALFCTYMRSGWLALGVSFFYLLYTQPLPVFKTRTVRKLGAFVLVVLLAGTLVFRTHGDLIGNPHDRSTLGRFQIWRVSTRVIAQHPFLGNGQSTYRIAQIQQMTPALQAFNPMNSDAKSLLLNFAAEFGLLGVSLLVLVGVRYRYCYHRALEQAEPGSEAAAILVATMAGGIAIAVAGLADTPILEQFRTPSTLALALLLGASAVIARDTLPASGEPTSSLRIPRNVRRWALVVAIALIAWTSASSLLLVRQALPRMDHYVNKLSHPPPVALLRSAPPALKDALVAAEDHDFYTHHGIDWEALHRSLRKDVRAGHSLQGGSTITMQAVRYTLLPSQKTPARKVAEIVLASLLERRLSKPAILRLYLSSVTFGLHTAGIAQATHVYFNKLPDELTLAECAFLVGVLSHPPTSIDQVTDGFVQETKARVLNRMAERWQSKYDSLILESARREPLHFAWEKPLQTLIKENL